MMAKIDMLGSFNEAFQQTPIFLKFLKNSYQYETSIIIVSTWTYVGSISKK